LKKLGKIIVLAFSHTRKKQLKQGGIYMQVRLILICALLGSLLYLSSCSTVPSLEGINRELSCDDFMNLKHIKVCEPIEVAVGDTFTVALCSNPSTGFSWSETAPISNQTVVRQIDHQLITSQPLLNSLSGTGNKEVWTFEALAGGVSTISMEYSQPWQGGDKNEWSVILTVVANDFKVIRFDTSSKGR